MWWQSVTKGGPEGHDQRHRIRSILTAESYQHVLTFRVRYSETDQMGTYYNSRALEWFECGRTEWLRAVGLTYATMEERGVLLPLVEAHVEYLGRARYDDLLSLSVTAAMAGKARVRFEVSISQAVGGRAVTRGYTIHAVTDAAGHAIRPPAWLVAGVCKPAEE